MVHMEVREKEVSKVIFGIQVSLKDTGKTGIRTGLWGKDLKIKVKVSTISK